jgi:TolA-binding protein
MLNRTLKPWATQLGLYGIAAMILLTVTNAVYGAGPAEKSAFNSASNAFGTAVWDRAEKQFAEFVEKFPDSNLVPQAILLEAQARFEQTNYSGAIGLLSANQVTAGKLLDQYLYWLGKAQFQSGAYRASAESFEKLVKEDPSSSLRLDAILGEAIARARVAEWARVIELLQKPDGAFQNEARTNFANELVPRGYLLLSEAQMVQRDYKAAEKTLEPLGKLHLPKLAWQWEYLRCRIQLADGRAEQALTNTANLIIQAGNAGQPALQAESIAFKASILESLGRLDQAIETYKENLAPSSPPQRQRQASLKITRLCLLLNKNAEAAQTLEQFVAKNTNAPSTDQALLLLGELQLGQYLTLSETNRATGPTNLSSGTNILASAQSSFESIVKMLPQSTLYGKAFLDLGWCAWLQGKMAESQKAFQSAVNHLPVSVDQATAIFKLADAQFQQQDFNGAISNYTMVLERFASVSEVSTNLFEPALYQTVRAALAITNLDVATNAVEKLLANYPNGFRADGALLLTAQELNRNGHPGEARQMFLNFAKVAPNARSLPEMQLAVARTYEQQDQWVEAIQQYEDWLNCFTNHPAKPRAMYSCGWANFQAGRFSNALAQFTNVVTQFPTNELAPRAQWWVADYYYNLGDLENAETKYQLLFQNFPPSELTWQAQMMAGRVAVKHQGWSAAKVYFTKLYNDTNCPTTLRVQALFALGDTWMNSPDSAETNKFANYAEALGFFRTIVDKYPTNKLAPLAWGEMAICHLQWLQGLKQYETDTNALHDFQQVIDSPLADATARSIAKVGLATLLEKQAEQKTGAEQAALLRLALNHYLDVFHGTILKGDEKPDIFWVKKSGIEAARLAEALQEWLSARRIYEQLKDLLPPLRARFEKNILKVQEHLD